MPEASSVQCLRAVFMTIQYPVNLTFQSQGIAPLSQFQML